jgi:nicotinamide-nucleotide amidase
MNTRAGIITIGDEILIGQIINTNVAWLGDQLTLAGLDVIKTWTIGDRHDRIIETLSQAVKETDLILITGGLGPTRDDVTKKAIADFVGVPLVFHQPTYLRIQKIFEKLGRTMSPSHNDQCLMPEGVSILHNRLGTAPGMLFHFNNKTLISMPGVPFEMKAIMEDEVLPVLLGQTTTAIAHTTLLTAGEGETTIENKIKDIVSFLPENISIAYLPSLGQVRVRVTGKGKRLEEVQKQVDEIAEAISRQLSDIVYGVNVSSLEKELLATCRKYGLHIGTAESCTGGAIAAKIVSVPGSSDSFVGSIIAYSNQMKSALLDVPEEILTQYGAVSEQTVVAMMKGAIRKLGVNAAVAVSGIAGPDGGTEEKPVGTIWICAGNENTHVTYLLKAGKERAGNIETTTIYALNLLRKWILKMHEKK